MKRVKRKRVLYPQHQVHHSGKRQTQLTWWSMWSRGISLGVGGCRCGFWDAVDGMCITMIVPHGLFGVVWCFFLWCGCFWVSSVFIDTLGVGFRGKCFMNTCPLLGLGCGVFLSLFLCLHCVLGGLGVLDQGADSTLRDPQV